MRRPLALARQAASLLALPALVLAACTGPAQTASGAANASDAPHTSAAVRATGLAPTTALRSGYADMSPALQAMQDDDTSNPASLLLADGQARFQGECSSCHPLQAMAGVAVRYPAFDAALGKPITLAQRIEQCRQRASAAEVGRRKPALTPESEARLALELAVSHASRKQTIPAPQDPRLAPWLERGRALFHQRLGQLDLSCAQCHDGLAGRRLAGSLIPQGHPNAYPLYRAEWQAVGSLQRRLRSCLNGVRAQVPPYDHEELMLLELYLMQRAQGLVWETPGVRP